MFGQDLFTRPFWWMSISFMVLTELLAILTQPNCPITTLTSFYMKMLMWGGGGEVCLRLTTSYHLWVLSSILEGAIFFMCLTELPQSDLSLWSYIREQSFNDWWGIRTINLVCAAEKSHHPPWLNKNQLCWCTLSKNSSRFIMLTELIF